MDASAGVDGAGVALSGSFLRRGADSLADKEGMDVACIETAISDVLFVESGKERDVEMIEVTSWADSCSSEKLSSTVMESVQG